MTKAAFSTAGRYNMDWQCIPRSRRCFMGSRLSPSTGLLAVLLIAGMNVTNKGRITAAEPTHAKATDWTSQ
jgi:hypothetical protein